MQRKTQQSPPFVGLTGVPGIDRATCPHVVRGGVALKKLLLTMIYSFSQIFWL